LQPMNIINYAFHRPTFSGLYSSEGVRYAASFVHEATNNRKYKFNSFGWTASCFDRIEIPSIFDGRSDHPFFTR